MLNNNEFCIRCTRCCRDTEMVLTYMDIGRLTRLGHKGFYKFIRGFYRLVNIDGHCIFLDPSSGKCVVYEHRPLGCRAYPLIYDERRGIVIDSYCPLSGKITCNELAKGIKEVVRVLREIADDYGYVVDWKLVEESSKVIMEKCIDT
ncbi:MAG: YkgJ family cysteine cluster protein [Desulfurococcaceae archaeon]